MSSEYRLAGARCPLWSTVPPRIATCVDKKIVFENRLNCAAEQIVLLDIMSVVQGATFRQAEISRAVITEFHQSRYSAAVE